MDEQDLKRGVNTLIKPGIANTEQIVREYLFTDGNELNYKTQFSAVGTVTISELPESTVAVLVKIRGYNVSTHAQYQTKRNSLSSIATMELVGSWPPSGSSSYITGTFWAPTEKNTLYINAVALANLDSLYILGYKVKGD
jgi:hypothetical protein